MAQDLVARTKGETGLGAARAGGSRINWVLIVVELCILLGVLVLFNVYPEKVGIYSSATQPYLFVPLLTPEWLAYMPWLNTWWILALALALVKLVYGRWTQALRWADLGLHLIGIFVIASVIWGVPLAAVEAGGASAGVPTLDSSYQHAGLSWIGFESALGLVLIVLIIGLFTRLAKMGIRFPVLRLR
jgi:hypothetical protein